ncbi:MAG: ubiquinol-cytochrome c reductase iron-sulfur subunit [Chloroflexi bacterium]|nr:ubiquinol-cytochrome c reductase iron-sulfur subunit [Chloroflexota bacterium]MBV9596712.1 ubiquinol-cytochrome c reductase iron-sulfur subunit [Chloroflexota bacterium]
MADNAEHAANAEVVTRRRFLSRISLGLSALAGAVVSVPILAYLLSPLLQPGAEQWRDVGLVENFQIGDTVQVAYEDPSPLPWAGQTARTAVWLRRDSETEFNAYSINCTHLGCPVNWIQDAELFLCPCHGGVYNADGTVAGGPPPHPLSNVPVRITDDQRVQVLPVTLAQTMSQS